MADVSIQRDPRAALERFGRWPVSERRNQLISYVAAEWVGRDATAALAWARERPPGDAGTRVLTRMSFALAQTDPARAMAWANLLPGGGIVGVGWGRSPRRGWRAMQRKLGDGRALPAGAARESGLAGIEAGLGGAQLRRHADAPALYPEL